MVGPGEEPEVITFNKAPLHHPTFSLGSEQGSSEQLILGFHCCRPRGPWLPGLCVQSPE